MIDKKTNKKKKVVLKNVFVLIYTVSVVLFSAACSGSRTGTAVTFSDVSLEESEKSMEGDISDEVKSSEKKESLEESEVFEESDQEDVSETTEAVSDQATKIFVHVCGAVQKPGVYELHPDSRVYEGIEAAGGLTKDADEAAVNQAGRVEDGQQIYVYTKEETKNREENCEQSLEEAGESSADTSTKVNLNTARKEELMTLTGIGEAKAQAIIDYRENNGSFRSVEEIMKIDGIKQGVFQKIKDDITI